MIFKITLIFLATIFAFWLSAICGGGASLILIPILNFTLPPAVIPFSLTIGTFTSSASRIIVFKKSINWKIFFWFVPFSIPAVLLGAFVMKHLNPVYLQFFVALFLITNVTELFRSKKQIKKEQKPYPNYILAIVGFLAGFVSGATGAIGLLFNRFYLRYGLTKEEIVATRAANEIFLHLIKLIIYVLMGLYSTSAFWMGIAIAVGAIASSYTIKYILPYLSDFLFRKIGYGAMVVSGVALLLTTSTHILANNNINLGFGAQEEKVNWLESEFALDYSFGDGFELEVDRSIQQNELPTALKLKEKSILTQYDKVIIQKRYRLKRKPSYQFYCFKNDKITEYNTEE